MYAEFKEGKSSGLYPRIAPSGDSGGVTPTLALLPPHLLLLTMPPLELTAGTTHRAGKDGSSVAFVHFSRGGH
jgi:hypothetical protein